MSEQTMHVLDWIVVLCYFGTIVSMGLYFSKRQKTTGQYYTGGRSLPAWAVGISILSGCGPSGETIAWSPLLAVR